jgi:ankyrin repeat protein
MLGLDSLVRWRLDKSYHHLPVHSTSRDILSLSNVKDLYRKLAYVLYSDRIELDQPVSQLFQGVDDIQIQLREVREFIGEHTLVNLLLADGPLLSSYTPNLLQAAVLTSNVAMVMELLDKREEKWDESNIEQWLGAFLAVCQTGSEKILHALFQKARNPNTLLENVARRDLLTPVASYGHSKHDSHQLSPAMETEPGTDSPLQVACRHGHKSVVQLLIRHGAYRDSTATGSPLMETIRSEHNDRTDIVSMLLDAGVTMDAHEDKTPLQVACELGRTKIVDMLLRYGACSDVAVRSSAVPLLTMAVRRKQDDLLATLLQGGIKSETFENKTPLQWACEMGQVEAVSTLLRYGASPNPAEDGWGSSPLVIAVESGQEELVMMLLYAGAKSTAGKTKTPIQAALEKNNKRIIRLLLARTSDVRSVKYLADGKNEEIRELFDRFDYR